MSNDDKPWTPWNGGDNKPSELEGKSYRAKFRSGAVAHYKLHHKARWTNTNYAFDIVAYQADE